MVIEFGDETLVFIILLLSVYLPHICFNHFHECLAIALLSSSCFSIFCACIPFQRLGFEDLFLEGLMVRATL